MFNKNRSELAAGEKETMSMGINEYCENMNMGSPSSLPPLVDSYINFDQNETKLKECEQVSCFSNNFSRVPPSQVFPHITHMDMEQPHMLITKTTTTTAPIFNGGMPDLGTFSCDKMVIKAMLNQLSNVEDYSPSFGEGCSSESYLSELGLAPLWNHYC